MKSKNGLMYLLIIGEIIILVLILALGMVRRTKAPGDYADAVQNTGGRTKTPSFGETPGLPTEEETVPAATEPQEDIPETAEVTQPEGETREQFSEEIEGLLAEMTVEQKVAQLFMVSPETLTGSDRVDMAGDGTRAALQAYPVGGMLYSSLNYVGGTQIYNLISNAQSMSAEYSGQYLIAGMISDQEGSTVIAAARVGQESQFGALLNPQAAPDPAAVAELIQFPLYQNLEQLSAGQGETRMKCYLVGEEGQGAVEALQNGADMLCVTSGFTEAYQRVLDAAATQEISGELLDNAVGHILVGKQAVSGQAENNEE